MFGDLGAAMKALGNIGKIKEEMANLHQQAGRLTAEGVAGGGMVAITVNGKFELVGCKITDEALSDRELLEDLMIAAANQAVAKVREQIAAETAKMAANLGLPPNMLGSLPGMG